MDDRERQFHQVALDVYEKGKIATGYRGTRYLQKVRKDGGVKAAKSWLKREDAPTGGFLKLVEFGRLDVSLEAQVLKEPWSSLFTPEELEVARKRLARYGYFDQVQPTPRDPEKLPEEVDEALPEGRTKTISVNVFERNPKARKLCLKHYGPKCIVCGMDFLTSYGADVSMHVHHLCPVSAIRKEYVVDPVADLRPVCPNCHAVIHMQDPPLTIEKVRQMLKQRKGKL